MQMHRIQHHCTTTCRKHFDLLQVRRNLRISSHRTSQMKLCAYLKNCAADDWWRRATGRTSDGRRRRAAGRTSELLSRWAATKGRHTTARNGQGMTATWQDGAEKGEEWQSTKRGATQDRADERDGRSMAEDWARGRRRTRPVWSRATVCFVMFTDKGKCHPRGGLQCVHEVVGSPSCSRYTLIACLHSSQDLILLDFLCYQN
jgi:hypothetical protein